MTWRKTNNLGELAKEYGKPTFKTIGEVNQAMSTKVGEPPSGGSTPLWGGFSTLCSQQCRAAGVYGSLRSINEGPWPSLPNLSLPALHQVLPAPRLLPYQDPAVPPPPTSPGRTSGRTGRWKPPRKSLILVLKNSPLSTELPLAKTNSYLNTGLPDRK